MPSLPLHPCSSPGCKQLLQPGHVCPVHGSQHAQRDRERGTTTERGYGWDWQQAQKLYLVNHPMCELRAACADLPLTQQVATLVHHRKPIIGNRDLRLVAENFQALCVPCHALVTRES